MNKILDLFDERKVKSLFKEKVLPFYPDFSDIKKIQIKAYKKQIWETTYHVVLEFDTVFLTKKGKTRKMPIFCSAHSNEPRENFFIALNYLWDHNFSSRFLSVPHPLFYSEYYHGVFYRGVAGETLYHHIIKNNRSEIEFVIPMTAKWFAKLHNLPTKNTPNFNPLNSRIKTALPGVKQILDRIRLAYPDYYEVYSAIYEKLDKDENYFFNTTDKRWLVHGDAHPENVICMSKRKIAVIDFADLCLSDYARDLGSFLQQLDYMCGRKIGDNQFTNKIKKSFLDNYFANFKNGFEVGIDSRINNYYNWTAMRTATYFLTRYNPDPERAKPLVEMVVKNLGF